MVLMGLGSEVLEMISFLDDIFCGFNIFLLLLLVRFSLKLHS